MALNAHHELKKIGKSNRLNPKSLVTEEGSNIRAKISNIHRYIGEGQHITN